MRLHLRDEATRPRDRSAVAGATRESDCSGRPHCLGLALAPTSHDGHGVPVRSSTVAAAPRPLDAAGRCPVRQRGRVRSATDSATRPLPARPGRPRRRARPTRPDATSPRPPRPRRRPAGRRGARRSPARGQVVTGTPVNAISTSMAGRYRQAPALRQPVHGAASSGSGRPTGHRSPDARRASRRAQARAATGDPPAGAGAPRPRARTRAPAPRAVGASACRLAQQATGPGRPRRQVPEPLCQRRRVLGPRRHQLHVAVQGIGQLQRQVGRTHPHALAQLGQAPVGQGPATGGPDLGRAAGRGDHGEPPLPAVGGGRPGAAGRLARLARRQVARQPVAAGPVRRRLTAGHHAAERHPGPVLADAEEAGQAHELGHRQLGRIHAEQRAGQDGPGRQRWRLVAAVSGPSGGGPALRGCVTCLIPVI